MTDTALTSWKKDMAFDSTVDEHTFPLDASDKFGGRNYGPRPKALLLAALGGCTGMDVISILNKMQLNPSWFDIKVEGDQNEEHPKIYKTIRMTYLFKESENLDKVKIEKAVALSQEKYCAVSAMLGHAAKISWNIQFI